MSQDVYDPEDIPDLIHEALIEQHGESQDRHIRGFVPSQSLKKVMGFLDADQVQAVRGKRRVKDQSSEIGAVGHSLPQYVDAKEHIKREMVLDYDRADHRKFDWGEVVDFMDETDLRDIAVEELVFRMDHKTLRDHLFELLQTAIDYPAGYKKEFRGPFYFVMESRSADTRHDRQQIKDAHSGEYLRELGWQYRTLDLVAIWSHYGWTGEGGKPMGVSQERVEEYAFNQRQGDRPVFAAVNSRLVVNKWREPFGRGLTDTKRYEWGEQEGWVRA